MAEIRYVSIEEMEQQKQFAARVRDAYMLRKQEKPLACVRTYGCQQNVSDSERMKGMLETMGFGFTEEPEKADFILFNTCAVREHAVDRVFGNVGALKHIKTKRPETIIALCGCMVQQPHVAKRLKEHYPFVNLVFGTHVIHRLPELLWQVLHKRKRVSFTPESDGVIAEGIPTHRDGDFKAFVPIMYGCNNFCTYCIVPYVRGRERSRDPEIILSEVKQLVAEGYTDIMLLGQNVNSYGKGEAHGVDFPALLEKINAIDGDFVIRFMTSHPKDATERLFDTIAACEKVSRHFHLPFQSGSSRVLKAMNRHYDREQYLALIDYARKVIPDISFTSDVIVGFPGETREEFEETLSLVKEVDFAALFTFIYSPRVGTPAAEMPDPISKKTKTAWFKELTDLQEQVAAERQKERVGKVYRALIEIDRETYLEARLQDNTIVRVTGGDASLVGQYKQVKITAARSFIVHGEIVE